MRLAGIDPSVLLEMNKRYEINLRPVTFGDVYNKGRDIPTVGSYAYLICSKDVPKYVILKLLKILDKNKVEISGERLTGELTDRRRYLLDEYGSLHAFKKNYGSYVMDLMKNLFVFIVTTVITTVVILTFVIWCFSSYKQVGYFRRITKIYTGLLPENTKLDGKTPPFYRPIINQYQNEIISNLVRGIGGLIAVIQEVREDYETGGVTASHYSHLLESVWQLRDLFRRNLFRRLLEVLEARRLEGEFSVTDEFLRHYHTAGYLTSRDYHRLVDRLQQLE